MPFAQRVMPPRLVRKSPRFMFSLIARALSEKLDALGMMTSISPLID
jgi:hypothetical protein